MKNKLFWFVFGAIAICAVAASISSFDIITVTDEAYGATWDGSVQVPTKNAVYDKIQSLSGATPYLVTYRTNSISLASTGETTIFTVASNYFWLSRVFVRCRNVDTATSAVINFGQSGTGSVKDTDATTITLGSASSNSGFQVVYPRVPSGLNGVNLAQALAGTIKYNVGVTTAATGGGGNCVVDIIVEGFYLAL